MILNRQHLFTFIKMKLAREAKAVEVMIKMYCKAHHHTKQELCSHCQELNDYAKIRVSKCKYGVKKPVCAKCTTHCYKPELRLKIKQVMRYAGPRMIYRHPIIAIEHLLHSWLK